LPPTDPFARRPSADPSARPPDLPRTPRRYPHDPVRDGGYDAWLLRHTGQPPILGELPAQRHYLATFGWTMAWYSMPLAIFAAWSLTFPADPGTACAHPTAGACPSPRAAALAMLIHGIPRVAVALGIALLVAGVIRVGSGAWRPVTVGFSAAIIGAGVATVLFSVLSGTG
jgi:hypothetical protein